MPNLTRRLQMRLRNIFLGGPPEDLALAGPPVKPVFAEPLMKILEYEDRAGREATDQEVMTVTGWNEETLGRQKNALLYARTQWRVYQQQAAASAQQRAAPPAPVEGAPDSQHASIPGEAHAVDVLINTQGRSFSGLSADDLSARRRAILANTPFDLPAHRKFMNGLKDTWRVIGPIAFVVFTVWEVYYFMNHFLQAKNLLDVVLLWGISLIIEIPFMIATYDQSERRERAAERRARGEPDAIPGRVWSLLMWLALALVNVAGQVAFLAFVTHAGYALNDPSVLGLWFFIILRVTGVIVGDCYTAFHLLPTEATIDRVLRAQKAQMEGDERLAKSDAERLRREAETNAQIRHIQVQVEREQRESDFFRDWQVMNMDQTLERQRRFMEFERRQFQLPQPHEEPITGELKREEEEL